MIKPSGRVLWLATACLALAALYWGLAVPLHAPSSGPAVSSIYRLGIPVTGKSGAPQVFEARQGERVTFMIRSDRQGEVHVHGYEKMVVLEEGGEVRLTFTADTAGGFPIHLHDAKGVMYPLGLLDVQPK